MLLLFFFFNQKTAYEMRISDWSSDVCSSDLLRLFQAQCLARSQESALAEQHQSAVGPTLEIAEPELFIDKAQSFIDSRPLLTRNANVWQRPKLPHLILFAHDGAPFILGPASQRPRHHFLYTAIFRRPHLRP